MASQHAVDLDSTSLYAWLSLAKSLRATGQANAESRALFEAIKCAKAYPPRDADAFHALAILYKRTRRLFDQVDALVQSIVLDPGGTKAIRTLLSTYDDPSADTERLHAYLMMAIEHLNKQATTGHIPKILHDIVTFSTANREYNLGNHKRAIDLCSNFPNQPLFLHESFRIRSSSFEHLHNPSEALNVALEWVEKLPNDSFGWYILGVRYVKRKQYRNAISPLRTSLELNPGDSVARRALANAYLLLNEEAEALQVLADLVARSPKDKTNLERYANLLIKCDRGPEARTVVAKLAAVVPVTAPWLRKVANLYRQTGELEKAETTCRRAIDLDPMQGKLHFNLALILADAGNIEGAAEEAQRAAILNPEEKLYGKVAHKFREGAYGNS